MKVEEPGRLVRIHIGAADRWHGQPLSDAIVQRARQEGLAGATVTEGFEGYGSRGRVHRAAILDISTDLPMTIEIVDTAAQIARFLPLLDEMMTEGLVAVLDCSVVRYGAVVTSPDGTIASSRE